ncbi:hypothetical protein M1B72_09150 [Geomonas paludis]|uniref:PEP-CTERM protein-sorting domain-containing protein n=1 Tax=Geomonas paludis TaxID=2740185 RepID=A0ABY4LL35_9BACT|nr:hypothetical protein [Geomonas paludis]UPU37856.1 hypothetical protein M1B72_09150 [Geomonas paludis]
MKNIIRLFAAALVLAASTAVNASQVYDYTYTFNASYGYGPGIVTGSFTGDAKGNLITNLSNISASYNGTPLTGSGHLYGSGLYSEGWVSGGAVASFDGRENNFYFSDADLPLSFDAFNAFESVSLRGYVTIVDAPNSSNGTDVFSYYNMDNSTGIWRVTPHSTHVPVMEGWWLLPCVLVGLGFIARRRTT